MEDIDRAAVATLLGREPRSSFEVVVRHADGSPVVIRNPPILDDGTPMPTRYWLVGEPERRLVALLESSGGVREANTVIDAAELADAHERYRAERDARRCRPARADRPTGGVGGTRIGVKCLHAHYAWFLAGGDDPVGRWVAERLHLESGVARVTGLQPSTAARTRPAFSSRSQPLKGRGSRPSSGACASPGSVRASTPPARWPPRRSSARSTVLREYRAELDRLGVERVRMTATSAARDAANRDDFFDAAKEIVGVEPELLSGDEEARLSFLGATADLDPADGPFLVVDIGGGSTGVRRGHDRARSGVVSVDMGCVRITEQFLHSDPPAPEELATHLARRRLHLDDVDREVPGAGAARTLVGLAGTITTVAAVEIGLAEYDRDRIHHFRLTAAAEDVFRTLATESRDDRVHNPGLEEARADVIVGGLLRARRDHAPPRLRRVPRVRGRHPRRPSCTASSTDYAAETMA